MGTAEDLMDIGDGVRSAVVDAPSLVGNIATGDVHGAVTDARNLLGDVTGVGQGLQHLGVRLGEVPTRYLGAMVKLADSKILAVTQLVIEGEKALTGSGDPEVGSGFRESAGHLDDALKTVAAADPADDQWDGSAATAYRNVNNVHRRRISATQVTDSTIAGILSRQAAQVIQTRQTLDEASQYLYDFGLTTAWMNFVPPLAAAKAALDMTAAAVALDMTASSMRDLAATSLHSAWLIRQVEQDYRTALKAIHDEDAADVDDETRGPCGTLIRQRDDLDDRPTRVANPDTYEVPDIDFPWGPAATPYTKADAPQARSRAVPPRTPGVPARTPGVPPAPSPAVRARPAETSGTGTGRAPLRGSPNTPHRKRPR